MFKTRLISGIILVAAALALIITGGEILLAASCMISLIGMYELYRVYQIEKTPAAVIGYAAPAKKSVCAYAARCNAVCNRAADFFAGSICAGLSKIPCVADYGGFFRGVLCSRHAFLRLAGKDDGAGGIYRMADFFVLLGLRYLCVLRGRKVWET